MYFSHYATVVAGDVPYCVLLFVTVLCSVWHAAEQVHPCLTEMEARTGEPAAPPPPASLALDAPRSLAAP